MGPCEHGPVIYIEPEGWYYQNVAPDDAEMILQSLSEGKVYEKVLPRDETGKPVLIPTEDNIPFPCRTAQNSSWADEEYVSP